ncbi:MAG TPA: RelA/SpoT family protein, partial [Salinivirgaceae bacterium]|nr:RelA/SpoT family protein [Salinivirgaceae bacterium]
VIEEIGLSKNSVISALLHDLIEINPTIPEDIRNRFGQTITTIVTGLQKISGLYRSDINNQSDKYIDLLLTIVPDVRIILVKLADRLHTLRSIKIFSEEKQHQIAMEAGIIYAPIAHRLGLYHIKSEMEEAWLKYTKPGVYNNIIQKLEETSHEREKYIEEFIKPIKNELNQRGYRYELKSRVKSVYSIWKKMETQRVRFEDVYDLFAIRIILDNIAPQDEKMACWTVYSIISNLYTPNPARMRDWISTPRKSGYESLHTTVLGHDKKMWVEVQIRTRRMDEIAEKGSAAHWRYKESSGGQSHDQWLVSIREILENPEIGEDENTFKANNTNKDIFVFTPKGELKQLPPNSTVLDFAYSIHSSVGDHCTGAKVNGKIAPIKHVLKSGDTVDVLTSKNQTPNESWLNIAITSKAKNRIKRSLKDQYYKDAEQGRETLTRKLSQAGLDLPDEFIVGLLKKLGFKNILDLYHNYALGKIDFSQIKNYLQDQTNQQTQIEKPIPLISPKPKSKISDDDYLIVDNDISRIDYKLAKCCNPVFGDPIFGFVSIEKGITIHRQNCPNASDLIHRYPYRIIKARWNKVDPEGRFPATINVIGIDQTGILNILTKTIVEELKLQLTSVHVDTDDGYFNGTFTIMVKDVSHIEFTVQQLLKINGVLNATRSGND